MLALSAAIVGITGLSGHINYSWAKTGEWNDEYNITFADYPYGWHYGVPKNDGEIHWQANGTVTMWQGEARAWAGQNENFGVGGWMGDTLRFTAEANVTMRVWFTWYEWTESAYTEYNTGLMWNLLIVTLSVFTLGMMAAMLGAGKEEG